MKPKYRYFISSAQAIQFNGDKGYWRARHKPNYMKCESSLNITFFTFKPDSWKEVKRKEFFLFVNSSANQTH